MQRPRNRQGRPDNHRGGERGSRGSGRGNGRGGRRGGGGSSYPVNVPSTSQVNPGSHVSIVLKIDQPTGRQVQGTVADVLTSGNHPRGIKVRLRDGRVGRVQQMATEEQARTGSEGLNNLGRNGEPLLATFGGGSATAAASSTSNFTTKYRDVRKEDNLETPPTGYSLGDFLPPDHALHANSLSASAAVDPSAVQASTAVCPVCGQFEGDEAAVAHHVNSHFD